MSGVGFRERLVIALFGLSPGAEAEFCAQVAQRTANECCKQWGHQPNYDCRHNISVTGMHCIRCGELCK
jgi:hypothetical protein